MHLLLDTHVALWAVTGSESLSAQGKAAILSADEVFVSVASVWEIAIKHGLGKGGMPVSSSLALTAFRDAGFTLLGIKSEHVVHVEQLPKIHRDPFDRLLVAQALLEPLTFLTCDATVGLYSNAIVVLQGR